MASLVGIYVRDRLRREQVQTEALLAEAVALQDYLQLDRLVIVERSPWPLLDPERLIPPTVASDISDLVAVQ